MLNPLRSSVYVLTVPLIVLSLLINLSCKIKINQTFLSLDVKTQDFDT